MGDDLKIGSVYLVQLCSGAVDPDAPLNCAKAALSDPELKLNTNGALMLCSPFNLDAFNARKQDVAGGRSDRLAGASGEPEDAVGPCATTGVAEHDDLRAIA